MPTYEYECRKCHHRFEVVQSILEKAIQTCPKCKDKVERLISGGTGFLFKGSGFYITDHRSKDYKAKAKAEKPEVKPEASKPKTEGLKDTGTGSKDQ